MAAEFHELSFSNFFYTIWKNTVPGHNGKAQCFNNLMQWAGLSVPTAQNLSPWINGKRPLPQDYADIIRQKGYIWKVKKCMKTNIIPYLQDEKSVINELSILINNDYGMHDDVRVKFCEHQTETAYYIALALYYSLTCRENSPVTVQQTSARPGIRPETIMLSVPHTRTSIIGRDLECKKIAKALSTHSIIFLWGVAGIGKSELAKYYINTNKDSFSNTIYIPFGTSIKESVANLNFIGDNPEDETDKRFASHMHQLYTYDSDTIVLLDNFDINPDSDPDFSALANGKFQLIITSRNKPIDYPEYEVQELSAQNCMELFKLHAPNTVSKKQTKKIIELAYSHTLLIVMIARTLKYTELDYEDIINALSSGITETPTDSTIPITKDGLTSSQLYQHYLFNLIELANLTQNQLEILSMLSLMPIDGISITSAKEYCAQKDLNDINYLVRLGYVSWNETTDSNLSVHPLIGEIVLKKNIENMPTITSVLVQNFLQCVYKEKHYPDTAEQRIGVSIFEWIISCETQNYCYATKDLAGFFLKGGQFYYVTEASKYIKTHANTLAKSELPYINALASYYQGTTYSQLANDKLAYPHFKKAVNYLHNKSDATPEELELYYSALIEAAACIEETDDSITALRQIDILETSLPEQTRQALSSRLIFKLAGKYLLLNDIVQADALFRECLDYRTKLYGADSVYVGLVYANIGFIYQEKEEYSKASRMYFDALKILEKHLPQNHINILRLYTNIAACLYASRNLLASQTSQIMMAKVMRAVHNQVDSRMIEMRKDNSTKKKSFRKVLDTALEPLMWYKPTKLTEINDCISVEQIMNARATLLPNHPLHPTDQEVAFTNMVDSLSNKKSPEK